MTQSRTLAAAAEFARALDSDDFQRAASLLAPGCTYTLREEIHRGPAEIIESYESNAQWARSTFDSVEYDSSVLEGPFECCTIHFVDRIRHAGEALEHHCHQVLTFDPDFRIVRIEHVDLPGEREKARAFFEACGVQRDS